MAKKMKIEVWSDIMCPFCYIGDKKLDDALAQFSDSDRIDVEFKSFELMPGLETYPIRTTNEMLAETKGMSVEQARQMNKQVAQVAAGVGLEMDSEKSIPANTINAHRLTHLAKKHGKQREISDALFRAHFVEGRNVDDTDTLVAISGAVGLDEAEVQTMLDSDDYTNDVQQDIHEARQFGITGVPFFVFDRKYAISGAQDAAVFTGTIEKAFGEWSEANPTSPFEVIEGQTCSIDGTCD